MKNRRIMLKRIIYLLLVCLVVMTTLPAIALADSGTDEHIHTDKDADTEKNEGLSTDSAVDSENAPEVEDNTTDDAGEAETNIPSVDVETDVDVVIVPTKGPNWPGDGVKVDAGDGFLSADEIADMDTLGFTGGASLTAVSKCGFSNCICTSACSSYKSSFRPQGPSTHSYGLYCTGCGYGPGVGLEESHSFSGNTCTKCGYTKSCSHSSTSRSYTTGCDWEERCNSCGETVRTGTTHGPYSYGSWSYYSSSQHRRTQRCDYGDWSGYDYASHSTTTSYGQYSSTQHSVRSYCSECGSYIGSTSYSSHSFSYGSWTNYSSTQHRRTKTCSTCGYSEYEYKSHSLSYGSWTSTGSSQHKRTVSCSCGYSTTETVAHTLTRTAWTSDGAAQHKRTASCGTCG